MVVHCKYLLLPIGSILLTRKWDQIFLLETNFFASNLNSIFFGCFSVCFMKPRKLIFQFVSVFRTLTETNKPVSKQIPKSAPLPLPAQAHGHVQVQHKMPCRQAFTGAAQAGVARYVKRQQKSKTGVEQIRPRSSTACS